MTSVCFFLASCGGGSGDSPISSHQPPNPPNVGGGSEDSPISSNPSQNPPNVGDLVSLSDSNNESEETESDNNEESEEIIDIIIEQPDPEEEKEETQTQQIIIIEEEEEDIPYVPPEEKEPETSAQTEDPTPGIPEPKLLKNVAANVVTSGTLDTYAFSYWNRSVQNGVDRSLIADIIGSNDNFNPNHADRSFVYPRETYTSFTREPGDFTDSNDLYTDPRDFRSIADSRLSLTYQGTNTFKGAYSYMGSSGEITDDVTLRVIFYHPSRNLNPFVDGYIGGDDGITLGDHNLGKIVLMGGRVDGDDGTFASEIIFNGSYMLGSGTMRGSFSNDGSADGSAEPEYPSKIAGEVEIKGFISRGNGNDLAARGDNGLAGVFIVEKD